MTIAEAIEILQEIVRARSFSRTKEPTNAIKLGMEALKRYQEERSHNADPFGRPLPGETQD